MHNTNNLQKSLPKVCVLMAMYNGAKYVIQQVDSILNQSSVSVALYINDDFSTDDSFEVVRTKYENYENVILLDRRVRHGSAGKNFYSLIQDVNFNGFDYVALSDQDDIWYSNKLSTSISYLSSQVSLGGVSTNVLAFGDGCKTVNVIKSFPQKNYDFIFESPGPGCTFVMTKAFVNDVKRMLNNNEIIYNTIFHHDWFIYAFARSNGYDWQILNEITMGYRQHSNNETGVNRGIRAAFRRFAMLSNGWYFDQIYKMAEILGYTCILSKLFLKRSIPTLFCLRNIFELRRNNVHAVALLLMLVFKTVR